MSFFISLSSLSGIYGSPGQSNYAAGCTFQDALARHRTVTGHRGSVTFDLGWLSTIGVVAESENLRRYQKNARIMRQVDKADLFAMFDYYCDPALPPLDVEHCQVLIGVFTQANFHAQREVPSPYLSRPLFAAFDAPHFWESGDASYMTKGQAQDSAAALFAHASGLANRSAVVVAAFRAKLARSLDVAVENVDPRGTPSDYGADSLMAVELRNWIRNDFGVSLAVFEIMGGDNILSVGKLVAQKAGA